MLLQPLITSPRTSNRVRIAFGVLLAAAVVLGGGLYLAIQAKLFTMSDGSEQRDSTPKTNTPEPFPIGVNPTKRTIEIDPDRENYVESYAKQHLTQRSPNRWFDEITSRLSQLEWYQTLATPSTRILIILPGERKEQVAHNFSSILHWNNEQEAEFLQIAERTPPAFPDGTFLPGRYILPVDATPEAAHATIRGRFQSAILDRYPTNYEQIVPLHDALIIASLLEREAYDFSDMRIISGIIWNRLFIDMHLQLDATLQYARVQREPWLQTWWPAPRPIDKAIDSPYNTYRHTGLPPSAIANPHVASVIAALNPVQTDCLFYFHDRRGGFHCSETYEEHVQNIAIHYGR